MESCMFDFTGIIDRVDRVGAFWQDGRAFGVGATIRLNAVLPEARLRETLDRLRAHMFEA